MIDIEKIF